MRFVKLGFISIIIIFLMFTVISLFIPSSINISRAINLAADSKKIVSQIQDTSTWKNWYPGYEQLIKSGTSISFREEKENLVSVEFSKNSSSKKINSTWQVIPYHLSDSITLQWSMQFKLNWYPWEKFGSLLYEKAYGQQMETGLNNLKSQL